MRSTICAALIAVGLAGFGASAQAAPVSSSMPLGAQASEAPIVNVQMMPGERRMMRHRMERRMMHRRMMRHRMMRHERRMMHRGM